MAKGKIKMSSSLLEKNQDFQDSDSDTLNQAQVPAHPHPWQSYRVMQAVCIGILRNVPTSSSTCISCDMGVTQLAIPNHLLASVRSAYLNLLTLPEGPIQDAKQLQANSFPPGLSLSIRCLLFPLFSAWEQLGSLFTNSQVGLRSQPIGPPHLGDYISGFLADAREAQWHELKKHPPAPPHSGW